MSSAFANAAWLLLRRSGGRSNVIGSDHMEVVVRPDL
jgi:hypothetical protein